jgi:hypothetical protein
MLEFEGAWRARARESWRSSFGIGVGRNFRVVCRDKTQLSRVLDGKVAVLLSLGKRIVIFWVVEFISKVEFVSLIAILICSGDVLKDCFEVLMKPSRPKGALATFISSSRSQSTASISGVSIGKPTFIQTLPRKYKIAQCKYSDHCAGGLTM